MNIQLKTLETKKFSIQQKSTEAKEYALKPIFGKRFKKISDKEYVLELLFELKDDGENISPLDVELVLDGVFYLDDASDEELEQFLNINAVQILFPYLRTMITTTMASLMIQPLVLPIMDVRKIFSNSNE